MYLCKYISQFSLLTIVVSYKVSTNSDLVNIESLLLEEVQD